MTKNKYTITGADGFEPPTKCCKIVVYGDDVTMGEYSMSQLIKENKELKEKYESHTST